MKKQLKRKLAVLLAFVMVFSLIGPINIQVRAAEESTSVFDVKLKDVSLKTGDVFQYSDADIVSKNGNDQVTSLTIMVNAGSINTVTGAITDKNAKHRIATWVWPTGTNVGEVENKLQSIEFTYESGMEVTVIVDGNRMNLPTTDTAITSYALGTIPDGSIELDNKIHYYMYVPYGATKQNWYDAYDMAKSYYFMGMRGYLVTISEKGEDDVLDEISTAGAWAGGAKVSIHTETFDQPTTVRNLDQIAVADSIWKWVCGPEAGVAINIEGSVAAGNGIAGADNGSYQNWRRPDGDEGNQEPNNYYSNEDNQGEWWLQVHFPTNGWNDLNGQTMTESENEIDYLSGYFVEFSEYPKGMDEAYSDEKKITVVDKPGHKHNMNITAGANDGTIKVYCDGAIDSDSCDDFGLANAKTIKITASDATYTGEAYDADSKITITGDAAVVEMLKNYPGEGDEWAVAITYVGKDAAKYPESAVPPTNAGDYFAVVTLTGPDDQKYVSKEPFKIGKANLTIRAKDLTIEQDGNVQSIPENLIVTGLLGDDEVTGINITRFAIGVNKARLTPKDAVIKNGDTVVTGNYIIKYERGELKVVNLLHDWVVEPEDDTPGVLDIYCEANDTNDPSCPYDEPAKLELITPSATYTGSPYVGATVKDEDGIINAMNTNLYDDEKWTVKVTYESIDGTTYPESSVPPTDAGKYNAIMTVTNPSDPENGTYVVKKPFEIAKKEITITPNAQEVGKAGIVSSTPGDVTVTGLVSGDTITAVVVNGDTTEVTDNGTLSVDKDSVVIKNGDKDVTNNYDIKTEAGTLKVVPAQHDWKAQVDPSDPSIIDVYCENGNPANDPDCPYLNPENAAIIKTEAPDAEYTGKPYDELEIDDNGILDMINSELPDDKQWIVDVVFVGRDDTEYQESDIAPTDVGKYNAIVTVTDSDNNKTITEIPFEINKKQISIQPKNVTVAQGGSISSTPNDVIVTGLNNGDVIASVEITGDTTAVKPNAVLSADNAVIKNGENNVTDNYEITYKQGTLSVVEALHDWTAKEDTQNPGVIDVYCTADPTVDPDCAYDEENAAKVELDVPAEPAIYTGQPYDGATIKDEDGILDTINQDLPDADKWTATITYEGRDGTDYPESDVAPTDAGKYNAVLTVTNPSDPENGTYVVKKPFEIAKKEITITPNAQEVGKGMPVSSTPADVTDNDGLVPGDAIVQVVITGDTKQLTDDGVLSIKDDSIVIKNGSKDVTDNYIITTETGDLKVVPVNHDWKVQVDSTNPSVIDIYCDNGNASDDPDCPFVGPENAAQINTTAPDATYTGKPYEGLDIDDEGILDIINDELPKDDQWSIEVVYEGREDTDYPTSDEPPVNAGKYNAIVTVTDSDGNDTVVEIPFEINKAELTVTPKDKTVAQGGSVSSTPNDVVATGLVGDDKIASVEISGDTANTTDSAVLTADNAVIKNGNKDVTDNYNISYNQGSLKVVDSVHSWNAKPDDSKSNAIDIYCDADPEDDPGCEFGPEQASVVELVAPKATYTGSPYAGADVKDPDGIIDKMNSDLPDDEKWEIAVTYEGRDGTTYPESVTPPTDAGKYNAIMTVTNPADPENGTYVIKKPFEIEKKVVTITPNEQEIGLDGPISSTPNDVTAKGLLPGDKITEVVISGDTTAVTNDGVLSVDEDSIVIKNGKKDVTNNYNIKTNDGTLKVVPAQHDWVAQVDKDNPTVIDIYCDNDDATLDPNCPYLGPDKAVKVSTDAPDAQYSGKPYAGLKVEDDGFIDAINAELPEDKQWTISVAYEGRDNTNYPKSSIAPTDAGKYNAIVTVKDSEGNKVQIKKPFEIVKKTITITPVEQYVNLGEDVESGADFVKVVGLVEGDQIAEVTISGNTSAVTKIGVLTVDPESVVVEKAGKDVTNNYNIQVAVGKLIVPAEHTWHVVPDPQKPGIVDVYCDNGDPVTDPGCDNVGPEKSGKIEVVAPSEPYSGEPYAGVTIKDDGLLDDINDDLPPEKKWTVSEPTYEGRDGTTYPSSEAAPEDAGKYNAVVTVTDDQGNTYVIKTPFEIEKSKLVITPKDQTVDSINAVSSTPKDVTTAGLSNGDVISKITIKPNADNTKLTAKDAVIKKGDKDVTANYDITYAEGKITVNKTNTNKTDNPKPSTVIPEPTAKEVYENETAMNAGLKVMQTKKQINVKWGKVPGANRYEIFVQYCGKNFKKKATKVVNSEVTTSVKVTKINGKKLNLKKNYKIFIVAYKVSGSQKVRLGESIRAHIVGVKNTTQTNVKSVKVKKSKFTIQQGKTAQIKAWTVLVDKTKHQLSNKHAKALRYRTDNDKVATVSAKGKIKAVGKGTCTVYVYARNGYAKKVKVTVK